MRYTTLVILAVLGSLTAAGEQVRHENLAGETTRADTDCKAITFSQDSFVCECTAESCDEVAPTEEVSVTLFTSSRDRHRFTKEILLPETDLTATVDYTLAVDSGAKRQTLVGFGGAVTDSAAINIRALPAGAVDKLLRSYYAPTGIEYSLGRLPMASCDFSTHEYSYDDVANDFELNNFTLAAEDTELKIPIIQEIQRLSTRGVRWYSSPWSAPAWMKTNGEMKHGGFLKGEPGDAYHKTWAKYFRRYIEAYKNYSIPTWAITVGNEPMAGFVSWYKWQSMGWTPWSQRDFIKMDLGPELEGLDVKIVQLDDNRLLLPFWASKVYEDPVSNNYTAGTGTHWYWNGWVTANRLQETYDLDPSKFIFSTEACEGVGSEHVLLGSWRRAENYAADIIESLSNSAAGWTDWNIALDLDGGPNYVSNFVDSPIIVDSLRARFLKQPMFYALGHFSKWLRPGDSRILSALSPARSSSQRFRDSFNYYARRVFQTMGLRWPWSPEQIEHVAAVDGDGRVSVVLLNQHDTPTTVRVLLDNHFSTVVSMPARSIQTVVIPRQAQGLIVRHDLA